MFWTVCLHSLGSCYFQGVWATCLPHKGRGVLLSALSKDTTSEVAGSFSTTSLNAEHQTGKLQIPFLKVFWYDSTREINPRSTDCKADALTTTPTRHIVSTRESNSRSTDCKADAFTTTPSRGILHERPFVRIRQLCQKNK